MEFDRFWSELSLSNMNLVIFDIDGTLTKTDYVDEICFVQALSDAHSISGISTDWAAKSHAAQESTINNDHIHRAVRPSDILKHFSIMRLVDPDRETSSS